MDADLKEAVQARARDLNCMPLGLHGREDGTLGDRAHDLLVALIARHSRWLHRTGASPCALRTSYLEISQNAKKLVGTEIDAELVARYAYEWRQVSGERIPSSKDSTHEVEFFIEGDAQSIRIWFRVFRDDACIYEIVPGEQTPVELSALLSDEVDWDSHAIAMIESAQKGDKAALKAVGRIKSAKIVKIVAIVLLTVAIAATPSGRKALAAGIEKLKNLVRPLLEWRAAGVRPGTSILVESPRSSSTTLRELSKAIGAQTLRFALPIEGNVEIWERRDDDARLLATIACFKPVATALFEDYVYVSEGTFGWTSARIDGSGIVSDVTHNAGPIGITSIAVDRQRKRLYLGRADGTLSALDIGANPTRPVEVAKAKINGLPVFLEAAGDDVLVGASPRDGFGAGLLVLSETTSSTLTETSTLVVTTPTKQFARVDNWVYQPADDRLGVCRIESSGAIVALRFADGLKGVQGVRRVGDNLIVGATPTQLLLIDVSDREHPRLVRAFDEPLAMAFVAADVIRR